MVEKFKGGSENSIAFDGEVVGYLNVALDGKQPKFCGGVINDPHTDHTVDGSPGTFNKTVLVLP